MKSTDPLFPGRDRPRHWIAALCTAILLSLSVALHAQQVTVAEDSTAMLSIHRSNWAHAGGPEEGFGT